MASRKKVYKTSSVILIVLFIIILVTGAVMSKPAPTHVNPALSGTTTTEKKMDAMQNSEPPAHQTTTLTFTPESSAASPIIKKAGDIISFDVMLNPGENDVSFVKMEINYDVNKLAPLEQNGFQTHEAMPSLLSKPMYTDGIILITLSIGADPTKGIIKPANIATVSFKTLNKTKANEPTQILFGHATHILSLSQQDGAADNVFLSGKPAFITIE